MASAQNYGSTELGWDPNLTSGATLGGSGTWDNGLTSNWWDGSNDVAWASGGTADFTGTGSTVTIASGGLTAGGLNFFSSGYTIAGADSTATLTLGGSTPTINLNGNTAAISTVIIGASGLTINGGAGGMLTLSNQNQYTGDTTINGGTLSLATGSIYSSYGFGNAQITIEGGATVAIGGWGDGAAAGFGQVAFAASNLLVDNGTIEYTGGYDGGNLDRGFTIGAGGATLDAEGGANTFTLDQGRGYGVASASGGTLTLTGASNGNFNLILGGTGALLKSGTGTWVASNNNSFTGGTTVNGGTLELTTGGQGASNSLGGTGPITINNGGTLLGGTTDALGYYNNSASNGITINEGGTLSVVAGSRLSMDRNVLSIGGTIAAQGGGDSSGQTYTFRDNQGAAYSFTSASDGTPSIISAQNAGLSGQTTFDVTAGGGPVDLNVTGSLADNFGAGSLVKTGNGVMVFSSGGNSYSGGTTISAGTLQIGDGSASNGSLPGNVTVNSAGTLAFANPTAFSWAGNISGGGITSLTGAGPLTITGSIIGTGSVRASGAGAVTLSGGLATTGSLRIGSGASISVGSPAGSGLSSLYYGLGDSSTQVASFATLSSLQSTIAAAGTPNLISTATTLNIGSGFPYNNGGAFNAYYGGALDITTAGTYTFSTTSDDGSMLWIDGADVVSNDAQQSSHAATGSVYLSAGMHDLTVGYFQGGGGLSLDVQMSAANGDSSTFVDLNTTMTNGATITPDTMVGSLQGSGNLALSTGNLLTGFDNTSQIFSGSISGIGGITKLGTGIQTLSGTNFYTGGTIVSEGELNISSDAALGATSGTLRLIGGYLQAGTSFSLDPARSVVLNGGTFDTNGYTLTVPGVVSGSGALVQGAQGTLVLSNTANTYTGGTTVSAGTLQIGDGVSSNGSLPGNVVNNATLTFNNPTSFSYAGNISGSGVTNLIGAGPMALSGTISGSQSVTYASAGGLSLTGANTYTGTTRVSAATVTTQAAGLGYSTVNLASSSTLSVSSGNIGLLGLYYNAVPALGLGASQSSVGSAGKPAFTLVTPSLDFASNGSGFPSPYSSGATNFEAYYTGLIDIPTAGTYYFATRSDDGSSLAIDGNVVVSNSAGTTNDSAGVTLSAGEHQITLGYFQGGGGFGLIAQMGTSTSTLVDINTTNFQLTPDATAGSLVGTGSVQLTTGGIVIGFDNSNQTFGGIISGAGGVMKVGSGTQIFTNTNNSYTGGTIVAGGILNVSADSGLGATNGTLTLSGGTLQAGASFSLDPSRSLVLGTGAVGTIDTDGNAVSIPGVISGGGGLTKLGAGTLTLSGANTYGGATTISAGTLLVEGAALSTVQESYSIASGAVLNLVGSATGNTGNVAAGTTTISGTGTLRISGGLFANNIGTGHNMNMALGSGGLIDIQSGATLQNGGWQNITWSGNLASLEVDTGGTLDLWDGQSVQVDALTGGGTITHTSFGNTDTFTIGVNNGSGTFTGTISEVLPIALVKNGSGTEVFTGSSSYSGGTTINNGTLRITNSSGSAFGSGGVIIGDQTAGHTATLAGTGIFTGALTVNGPGTSGNGGHIAPGINTNGNFGGIGTLATGALTLNAGANLDFDLGSAGTGGGSSAGISDSIAVNGALTLPMSGSVVLNLADNAGANGQGSIGLGTYAILTASSVANFSSASFMIGSTPLPSASYTFVDTGTEIDLTLGISSWSGLDNSGDWSDPANWNGSIPGATSGTTSTAVATFNNGGNGQLNVVPDANRNVLGITFDTASAGAYVVGTTGGNPLLLSNAGTIQTTSSVVNVETVNAPLVLEGNTYTIASNATSSSGTLNFGGSITGAASGATVLALTGTNTGANTVSGVISDGPSNPIQVVKSGTGSWTLSGDNTFSGGLNVSAGTLRLAAANTYSGNTTVSGGTLRIGNAAAIPSGSLTVVNGAGTLDLNGNNVTLAGGLSDGGSLGGTTTGTILSSSGTGTLTLNDNNTSYGGLISNGGGTTRVVAIAGSGTYMVLSGANSYTGGTTVNGELEAWSAGALGNGPVLVNDGGNLVMKGTTNNITYGQNLTLGSGTGGTATLALYPDAALNNPTWSGSITLTAGSTDVFTLGGSNLSLGGTINVAGLVEGSGVLVENGSTLTLNLINGNTYSGGTQIDAGVLSVGVFTTGGGSGGSNTALGAGPVNVAAGAALSFSNNGLNIPNDITLNGTRTGGSLIGAIATGGQSTTLSGTLTLAQTSNVTTFWSDKTFTIAGQVTGPGGLIIDDYNQGAQPGGHIVLSNPANNYQGDTTVNANTGGQSNPILYAGAVNVIPSGPSAGNLIVNGQFDLNTFSQTVNSLMGSGAITSGAGGTPVLTVTPSGTATFSGVIANPVSLTMDGSGTQVLTGANTFTGATTVTSGTLRLGDGTANNGSVAGNITDNAALVFANFNPQTYAGAISGSGSVTENGPNVLTLSGANTYTGNTVVSGGALTIGSGGSIAGANVSVASNGILTVATGGSIAPTTNLTDSGIVNFNNPTGMLATLNGSGAVNLSGTALTVSSGGALSGTIADANSGGSLIVSGGTLSLSGNNSYTGGTQITGGMLRVANPSSTSATGGGTVTVGSGGYLAGSGAANNSGFISGLVNVSAGGAIAPSGGGTPSAGSIGTLTVGSLTLNSGVSSASQINYQVASTSSLDSIAVTSMLMLPATNAGTPVQFNFYASGSDSNLVLPAGNYQLMTYSSITNGGTNLPTLSVNPVDLGTNQAVFSTNDGVLDLTISGGTGSAMWFSSSGSQYSQPMNWSPNQVPQNPGDIATFGSDHGTEMDINVDGAYTVGQLNFSDAIATAAYVLGGSGNLTLDNSGNHASITVASGELTPSIFVPLTLADSSGQTLITVNSGSSLTLNGAIGESKTYPGQQITLAGGGILELTAANTYAGSTTINAGMLQIDAGASIASASVSILAGGTLQLAGSTGALPSTASITTHGTGTAADGIFALTGTASQTVGVISGDILTTSPTTYSGNTTVGDGSSAASLSAAQILQNTLTINAGSTVTILPFAGQNTTTSTATSSAATASPALVAASETAANAAESGAASDPFTAIQTAIASGEISSTTGQMLDNRIAAIEHLAAVDPGLNASLLEDRVLAMIPSNLVLSTSSASLADTASGLLALDSSPLAASSASTFGSTAAAFVRSAAFAGNPAAVPEPSTLLLAALGGVGLLLAVRRRVRCHAA